MELISLSQIVRIVNAARTADNILQKQEESKLLQCYDNHPNQTVEHFIHLICMNEDEAARLIADSGLGQQTQTTLLKSFICVHLQNLVTIKNNQSIYPYIWEHLRPEVQDGVKQKLFFFLQQNSSVRTSPLVRQITRLIGCLAADLIHQNTSRWPQFPHMVITFIQKDMKCAFYILESFFEEKPERFKEIINNMGSIFQNIFSQFLDQQQDPSLILPALFCFNSYLKVTTEQRTTQNIKFSGEKIIKVIWKYHSQQNTQCQHQCVLVLLKTMLKSYPFFFQEDNQPILTSFQEFLSQKPDQQHKDIVGETLVDYCESAPTVFQQNPQNIIILLELVITPMLLQDIDGKWKQKSQVFSLEETDNQFDPNNRTALNNLVRIMRIVGQARVIKRIVIIVDYMFERFKEENKEFCLYYGLIILSQLGGCFHIIDDIKKYFPIVRKALTNENPLLRHAAANVLGQFSSGFESKLIKEYGEIIFNVLVQRLLLQKVSRIKIHILAALTNILRYLKLTTITSTYQNIIERVLDMANKSDTSIIIKQKAYFTLNGLVQAAPQNFIPYLQKYFKMFVWLFRTLKYKKREYINTKESAMETKNLIFRKIDKKYFYPSWFEKIMTTSIQFLGIPINRFKQLSAIQINLIPYINNLLTHFIINPTKGIPTYQNNDEDNSNGIKFGLYILSDAIEHMGYECFPFNWNDFLEVLLQFISHKMAKIRQAASYATGAYIMLTPRQLRSLPVAMRALHCLKSALGMPRRADEKSYSYQYAKDNTVAAIGRVVMIFIDEPEIRPELGVWLDNMPIKYDSEQVYQQTSYLIRIFLNRPQLLYNTQNPQPETIVKIFSILAEIVTNNLWPKTVKEDLKMCIIRLKLMELQQGQFRYILGEKVCDNVDEFLKQ